MRASFIVGDTSPGVRKGLDYLPREAVETQASEWAAYLAKKLTNKDEIALVRDPLPILTTLFFEDINQVAQKQRILLCFENFEATRQELQAWLLQLREYKPSKNIRLAIAGREPLAAQWDALRSVTKVISLDVFTGQEADAFLEIYNIIDAKRRSKIIEWSGRLPVLMSWLATPQGADPDPSLPTHDIVERFLRWVTDLTLRQVALLAALPQTFNVDILRLLLTQENQTALDEQTAFDWLRAMPFVQTRPEGWQYHPVVRRMMLRYQQQKSPQSDQQLHTTLANFYNDKRYALSPSYEEGWTSEQWRKDTLAYIYHFLSADPVQHWSTIISLLIVALRKRRAFALEIVKLLLIDDIRDQLSQDQNALVRLLQSQLQLIQEGSLRDGIEMFHQLCSIPDLSAQAKCYVFAYRGECYRLDERWEQALADFKQALQYQSDDAWTLASRGETYRAMKRYEEALADFDRAIALDDKDDWYRYCRAKVYFLTRRLDNYERDLTFAIELAQEAAARSINIDDHWRLDFNRALDYLFATRKEDARSLYDQFIAACNMLPRLQAAFDDLVDHRKLLPQDELLQEIYVRLQDRIVPSNQ